MKRHVFSNDRMRLVVQQNGLPGANRYHVEGVDLCTPDGWRRILSGVEGQEFSTSLSNADATTYTVVTHAELGWELRLTTQQEGWQASEVITLDPRDAQIRREQRYCFETPCYAAIHAGWQVRNTGTLRYTYALRAHEAAMAGLPALRSDIAWALPFPFHVWHDENWLALYGLDKRTSAGTLDFVPPDEQGNARVRVYYPDTTEQPAGFEGLPQVPQQAHFNAGDEVVLKEIIAGKVLSPEQEPLEEAERIAARLLLSRPWPARDLTAVANGIADFYRHCELWEPDALGPGLGWFLNMWTYTQSGTPQRKGPGAGYFDFGWGEGIAAEIVVALVRHWKRTGSTDLLQYVDEMTRGMRLFQRAPGADEPFYDRSNGERFGDFMLDHLPPGRRTWIHSLGHTGSQLASAYCEGMPYPDQSVRGEWLRVAQSIGRYLERIQRPNGDLPDVVDEHDQELNHKAHRIPARAVVCGLWVKLAEACGEHSHAHVDHAMRLAHAIEPEIERYAFYNQMIDGLASPGVEYMDGEGAYYVLEGLAPLYRSTRDPYILSLCRKAAAFGIAWTYFFDLPHAHNGIARGGQCCRMPDFPLLYPIGPAKAIEPLLILYESTGDEFYRSMAHEMVRFIGEYQWDCPDKPWHGGMIHAIDQWSGKHWGPEKCGQVDTGMATGNCLAAIEHWLAHESTRSGT